MATTNITITRSEDRRFIVECEMHGIIATRDHLFQADDSRHFHRTMSHPK